MALQFGQRPGREIGAMMDAEPLHLGRGDRPDPVEALDRKRGDEGRAAFRRDDADAVGLVLVGRQLGDELAIAHPGGGGEPGLGLDSRADLLGDGARAAEGMAILADVQIGFVEA